MNDKIIIIAIYKDGKTKEFNSFESACKETGWTINSIKTHCNRKCKFKNGLTFRYKNENTLRGKQNKRKGNSFELKVANDFKSLGFNTVTARSESKRTDDNKIDIIDLDNKLPCNIQTKYTTNFPNYFTISDQCSDKTLPFCIIWKKAIKGKNSPGTLACIPYEFFLDLIKHYKKE